MSPAASPFERIAIIGLGLIGGSIGLAVRSHLPGAVTTGYDADPSVRARAKDRAWPIRSTNPRPKPSTGPTW